MECDSKFLEGQDCPNQPGRDGEVEDEVDLLEGIKDLARREGIRTGVILSGLGALSKAVLRNLKIILRIMSSTISTASSWI